MSGRVSLDAWMGAHRRELPRDMCSLLQPLNLVQAALLRVRRGSPYIFFQTLHVCRDGEPSNGRDVDGDHVTIKFTCEPLK